jgi:hypothetical protein
MGLIWDKHRGESSYATVLYSEVENSDSLNVKELENIREKVLENRSIGRLLCWKKLKGENLPFLVSM